jgi:hypothetical protein
MINGWKSQYKIRPIIEGDFDYYKITFPFNRSMNKTTNKTMNKKEEYNHKYKNK